MEEYVRLYWSDYQKFMELEGFEDNSAYDPKSDSYFIEKEWYLQHKGI